MFFACQHNLVLAFYRRHTIGNDRSSSVIVITMLKMNYSWPPEEITLSVKADNDFITPLRLIAMIPVLKFVYALHLAPGKRYPISDGRPQVKKSYVFRFPSKRHNFICCVMYGIWVVCNVCRVCCL